MRKLLLPLASSQYWRSSFLLWVAVLMATLFVFYPTSASAQVAKLDGWCEDGGRTVRTVGSTSTTKVQRTDVGCTITVYDTGTTNLTPIYSDDSLTPKANPFVADTDNGYWYFYGAQGSRVDIQFTAGLAPPNQFASPFTRGDILIPGGGTGGGNTSSCGGATTGQITKFTSATTICNSIISESGTTDTVAGQFAINAISTSIDALAVRPASAATANTLSIKNSSGTIEAGYLPSGAQFYTAYTTAPPAVSAASQATIYYNKQGGSLDGTLTLSREGGAYQLFITVASDGTAGQCLQTDGAKVFSFGSCGGGGVAEPLNQVIYGTGPGVDSDARFLRDPITNLVQIKNTTPTTIFEFAPVAGYVSFAPYGTSSGNTTATRYLELAANGTNYASFAAPNSLVSSYQLTLPTALPPDATNKYLVSDTSGNLSFTTAGGGGGTCPAGSDHEVQYALSGNCAGAVGFTYYQTNATAPNKANVQIVAQDSAGVALNLVYASVPATEDIFQIQRPNIAGNVTWFAVSYNGAPYTPADITGNTGAHFGFDSFSGVNGAAFGDNASAASTGASIGALAAAGSEGVAVGYASSGTRAVVLGYQAFNNNDGEFIAGSRQREINNIRFGPGGSQTTSGSTSPITFYGASPATNNTSGGDIAIVGGQHKGTGGTPGSGSHGSFTVATSAVDGSSGNSSNAANKRFIISGFKIFVGTDATAQSLFEIALPTLAGASGTVFSQVHCNDATDVQNVATQTTYAVVNKAGAYTKTVTDNIQNSALTGGSTLTVAGSLLNGTNKVTFQITPDTSLTCSANKYYINWTLISNSDQDITILP